MTSDYNLSIVLCCGGDYNGFTVVMFASSVSLLSAILLDLLWMLELGVLTGDMLPPWEDLLSASRFCAY